MSGVVSIGCLVLDHWVSVGGLCVLGVSGGLLFGGADLGWLGEGLEDWRIGVGCASPPYV